jgi:hypothetical protein
MEVSFYIGSPIFPKYSSKKVEKKRVRNYFSDFFTDFENGKIRVSIFERSLFHSFLMGLHLPVYNLQ